MACIGCWGNAHPPGGSSSAPSATCWRRVFGSPPSSPGTSSGVGGSYGSPVGPDWCPWARRRGWSPRWRRRDDPDAREPVERPRTPCLRDGGGAGRGPDEKKRRVSRQEAGGFFLFFRLGEGRGGEEGR